MPATAAITYDGLPHRSGGVHRLRDPSAAGAIAKVTRFLDRVAADVNPRVLRLDLHKGPEEGFARRLERRFRDRFGAPLTGAKPAQMEFNWAIRPNQLVDVAEEVDRSRPIPEGKYGWPQLMLFCTFDFAIADPGTGEKYLQQTPADYLNFTADPRHGLVLGQSMTTLYLATLSEIKLFLSLPFQELDPKCQTVISHIATHAPVRLSASHWKRWTLNRNQTGYVGRRIKVPAEILRPAR